MGEGPSRGGFLLPSASYSYLFLQPRVVVCHSGSEREHRGSGTYSNMSLFCKVLGRNRHRRLFGNHLRLLPEGHAQMDIWFSPGIHGRFALLCSLFKNLPRSADVHGWVFLASCGGRPTWLGTWCLPSGLWRQSCPPCHNHPPTPWEHNSRVPCHRVSSPTQSSGSLV